MQYHAFNNKHLVHVVTSSIISFSLPIILYICIMYVVVAVDEFELRVINHVERKVNS